MPYYFVVTCLYHVYMYVMFLYMYCIYSDIKALYCNISLSSTSACIYSPAVVPSLQAARQRHRYKPSLLTLCRISMDNVREVCFSSIVCISLVWILIQLHLHVCYVFIHVLYIQWYKFKGTIIARSLPPQQLCIYTALQSYHDCWPPTNSTVISQAFTLYAVYLWTTSGTCIILYRIYFI